MADMKAAISDSMEARHEAHAECVRLQSLHDILSPEMYGVW